MASANPQPKVQSKYSPAHRVTAIVKSADQFQAILGSLRQGGFADEEIDVFMDDQCAVKLEPDRTKAGFALRSLKELEVALSGETEKHKELDDALRCGGMTINVLTRGDDEKKSRAAGILKAYQPKNIRYWGQWSIERL